MESHLRVSSLSIGNCCHRFEVFKNTTVILSKPELQDIVAGNVVSRPNGLNPEIDIASIGLHLGSRFLRYIHPQKPHELPCEIPTEVVDVDDDGTIAFPPGACILASTEEMVDMPLYLMGFIQSKGTIARGFVTVHLCDGQIDPGYKGHITLELVNLGPLDFRLRPGIAIAQLFFHRLTTPVEQGYSGRYQNSREPTSMRAELSKTNHLH
ncbi:MAG: dCTP deaminase [Proteobacteria bacterium]|nr:MAG: dCTP deaminase [Pseudomonadota bacterium]